MDEDVKELTELYRQLSLSGRQAALFHTNTVLRVENAFRQQYGLLPEGVPAQTVAENLPLKADIQKREVLLVQAAREKSNTDSLFSG